MATSCCAQFRLRLLQARLQRRLFALQRAFAAADFVDLFLKSRELRLQFRDLIFASEDGRRRFAIAAAVRVTARVNAVAIQQLAARA